MKTLRVQTKIAGALANVTSVTLANAVSAATYGVRRTDTGAAVVAAGTAMTRVATGVYEYDFDDVEGLSYEWRFRAVYGGESFIGGGTWTATVTPPAPTLELSDHDAVLVQDVDFYLAEYGEQVTVYPPAAASRTATGIILRSAAKMDANPRAQTNPLGVQLPNSSTTGISGAEWNNRFEVDVPRYRGGETVRMRTLRASHQDAAFITWELA